uniref:Uncharacterized protein n=1 Tax=Oryza rufipogon TaxID=4529 RepID=A0A0E0QI82_ORYRU
MMSGGGVRRARARTAARHRVALPQAQTAAATGPCPDPAPAAVFHPDACGSNGGGGRRDGGGLGRRRRSLRRHDDSDRVRRRHDDGSRERRQAILGATANSYKESHKQRVKHSKNGICNTKSAYKEIIKSDQIHNFQQLGKARNDLKFQGILKEPSQEEENKTRMETISEGNRCYIDAAWENTFIGIGIFFHMPMAHNAIFIKRFAPV